MKYLQYTAYIYLFLFVVFLIDGIIAVTQGKSFWLQFFMAAMAVFMFFFRKKFFNKMNK